MRLERICAPLLGIAILCSASTTLAQGWSLPKVFSGSQKKSKPSSAMRTLRKLDAGTKKFIRGTVDVITLKPLWGSGKKPKKKKRVDPWMRQTRGKATKRSFWGSWFTTPEEPRRPLTVGEWVGLERPQ